MRVSGVRVSWCSGKARLSADGDRLHAPADVGLRYGGQHKPSRRPVSRGSARVGSTWACATNPETNWFPTPSLSRAVWSNTTATRGAVTSGDGGLVPPRCSNSEIVEIGRRYGISNVRVFGSVARDEADEHSDLDLLIDVGPDCGYFEMAGFALDVEQLVGVFTQVATPNGLKKRLRPKILTEAIAL